MEATKMTEGRKANATLRLRFLVGEVKGAGVRVDSLLGLSLGGFGSEDVSLEG